MKDGKLVVNPKEAEIVKKIFAYYLEDDTGGYNSVTARLNEKGVETRKILRIDRKAMERQGTEEPVYLPVTTDWYSTIVKRYWTITQIIILFQKGNMRQS